MNEYSLPSPPPSPITHTPATPLPAAHLDVVDVERQAYSSQDADFGGAAIASAYPPIGSESMRDPLLLRDRLQSAETVATIRKRGRKGKGMGDFYEIQNEHIRGMLRSLEEDAIQGQESVAANATKVKIAVNASFIANCFLAVLQLYAAISSLSLSFFATALDAVFDPCANFVLNYVHKHASNVDLHKYPSGGSRFETIANIIYSAVMGCASVVLVVESIQAIVAGDSDDDKFHIAATAAVAVSFLIKFLLFCYCWAIRNADGQVRVLWEDHRNDLAINAFGIFTNTAGSKIAWWLDPAGAMVISIVLILLWGSSIMREFKLLAGISAPVDFMQKVIYKAMTFSDDIEKIDSCKVYSAGPGFYVELDIVMAGDTPLNRAHDVGQLLQDKIEGLPQVDRCFVHIDHEVDHKPEHAKSS